VSLAIALILAYLLGSIPTSYLAGRLGAGIDLREHGSRNLGATNVWRVLGPRYAVPVGLFDVAKGTVAAVALGQLGGTQGWMPLATGGAAVLGHVFPVFLSFRGGKGVATGAGMLLGLAPMAVLAAAAAWGAVLYLTGYVSAGSLTAAVVFPVVSWLLNPDDHYALGAGIVLGVFVFYTHRANVRRLLDGTESRFGRRHREA
jgi:glycerol-3-phosphate acyltransferase PlsY